MKKCLLIVYELKDHSVFNPTLEALVDTRVDFLIGSANVTTKWKHKSMITPARFVLNPKLNKLLSILTYRFLKLKFWEIQFYNSNIKKIQNFNPDFIISLVTRDTEATMNLSNRISNKINKPHITYMVDPIPPPKHWENHEIYRKSLIHGIKNSLRNSLIVCMGNQSMIEHQQSNVDFDILNKSFVFPDPIQSPIFLKLPENRYSFGYVGSFYGARSPKNLLKAFEEFSKSYINSELWIVGSFKFDINAFGLSRDTISKINFIEWVDDVLEIYERVNVLIDIDADFVGDVFMSSKLKKYLSVNRLILSVTSLNSPSERLLSKVTKTAKVSSQKVEEIVLSMEILTKKNINNKDFSDRDFIFEEMNVNNNLNKLLNMIDKNKREKVVEL